MYKRILIFGIFIIIVIIIVFLLLGKIKNLPSQNYRPSSALPVTVYISPVATKPQPTEYSSVEEKMEIKGIKVNNVYKNPIILNRKNDVTFFKNDKYEFVYLPYYQVFIITIVGSPFQMYIKPAEEEFIKALGISKEQACKLNVELGTVVFANPDYAGKTYPLSFCRNK